MKNIKVIVFVIVVAVATVAIFYFVFNKSKIIKDTSSLQAQNVLSPQTDSQGSVTVKVTPKSVTEFSASLDFEIVLDTHSGNLDQDLTKTSLLIDDKGSQHTPISWEGDPPQGHHRQGVLKFTPIAPRPRFIELKIRLIEEDGEKSFRWEL